MMPLHPFVVHFPPALLTAAAVLYAAGFLLRRPAVEVVGFCFHAAGLALCILAIFTGDYESDRIGTDAAIRDLMERHENAVMIATYGFGMLGIWAFLRQKSTLWWEKLSFLVAFTGLVALMLVGAHIGGKMVYEHGAGIAPMQEQFQLEPNPAQ